MKFQIGQEIIINEDFNITSVISNDVAQIKTGDKGFVDSNGFVHYTTGKARGKIQKLGDTELKGYDTENIAKIIFRRLKNEFGLDEFLDGYDIEEKDFINEIEDVLSDIF